MGLFFKLLVFSLYSYCLIIIEFFFLITMLPMFIAESLGEKQKSIKNIKITHRLTTQRATPDVIGITSQILSPHPCQSPNYPSSHQPWGAAGVTVGRNPPLRLSTLLSLIRKNTCAKARGGCKLTHLSRFARDFLVLALQIPYHSNTSVPGKQGWQVSLSHPSSRE